MAKDKDNVRSLPMSQEDMLRRVEKLMRDYVEGMKAMQPPRLSRHALERSLFDQIVTTALAVGRTADEAITQAETVIRARRRLKDLA